MGMNPNTLRVRDELLTKLLYQIASSEEIRPELILQGGGALHFIYSSPRYSSDLDFVCPYFPAVVDNVVRELMTSDVSPDENLQYEPRVSKRNGDFLRVSYHPVSGQGPVARVEIKTQTAEEYSEAKGKFSPLLVETPNELYADKIVASLHRIEKRGSLKGTDLFDLEYLLDNFESEADEAKIERKAASYNYLGWSRRNVEKVLKYIESEKNHNRLRRAIRETLLPDVYANRNFGREFFEKTMIPFERLRCT